MASTRLFAATAAVAFLTLACSGQGSPASTPRTTSSTAGSTAAASAAPSAVPSAAASAGTTSPSASPAASATSGATMDHGSMGSSAPSASADASAGASAGTGSATDTKAANLRTDLNYKLGEHLILASKATGAALEGRNDEFAAYGDLLNTNGTELGEMVGAAYGTEARDKFNQIWSAHNGFFVDYTTGVAKKDKAMQDKAVKDLTTIYVPQFSDLISGATGLPRDAVEKLTTEHVVQTKQIVDDQASKDYTAAYASIRKAYAHMQMIGDAIAPAIAKQNGDTFPGDPSTKGVDFRVALDLLLQEHLYLASSATGTALGGRDDEFKAAGKALNDNGTDIGKAIGSLYGTEAQDKFNQIWSAHNGFFVDYTTGVAKKDKAMQDKAVQDLTTIYVPQFAEFLAGATGLPQDAVAELTTEHVLTTKAIVDAQAGDDAAAAAEADRTAAQHMRMIGDPLAAAIVAKLPAKFS